MASEGGTSTVELSSNLVESLQVDFKNLSSESKKKYPQVKEVNTQIIQGILYSFMNCLVLQASEEAIGKLKNSSTQQNNVYALINQIIYPISQGCETKDVKLIKVSY